MSGRFEKGVSGNPNGRPKGTKNKTTQEIRNFLQCVMDDNLPKLQEDLDRMNPFQRWQILDKLSKSFLPTLTQSEVDATVNGEMKIVVLFENEQK